MLEAAYGEWPPRGLDIDLDRQSYAIIKVFAGDEYFPPDNDTHTLTACVSSTNRGKIWVRPWFPSWTWSFSVLHHEATHIMQILDNDANGLLYGTMVQHLLPDDAERRACYLAKDAEVQARLAVAMAEGYRTWKRLPATKVEFWAALNALYIPLHETACQSLTQTDEGRAALDAYCVIRPWQSAFELMDLIELVKIVSESSVDGALPRLHNDILPFLYGHLIEMYGDRLGRLRME